MHKTIRADEETFPWCFWGHYWNGEMVCFEIFRLYKDGIKNCPIEMWEVYGSNTLRRIVLHLDHGEDNNLLASFINNYMLELTFKFSKVWIWCTNYIIISLILKWGCRFMATWQRLRIVAKIWRRWNLQSWSFWPIPGFHQSYDKI